MRKVGLLVNNVLRFTILTASIAIAGLNINAEEIGNDRFSRLRLGIGGDISYLAPLIEAQYRFHDYLGLRISFQYTVSSNFKNVFSESKLADDLGKYSSRLKYTNFAVPLIVDFYPMKNQIRTSLGLGYMVREFKDKKHGKSMKNHNKIFFTAGLGYLGDFAKDSRIGYSLDLKCNILNRKLRNSKKDDWGAVPTGSFTVTYAL